LRVLAQANTLLLDRVGQRMIRSDTMSIFGSIMNAITFGAYKNKTGEDHPAAAAAPAAAPATEAAPVAPPPIAEVDVAATLTQLCGDRNLNWQTSIVDLMKVLSIDSSLENRKTLAHELGYTGALDGSAEMNIWLHKTTMKNLGDNGAKVPPAV